MEDEFWSKKKKEKEHESEESFGDRKINSEWVHKVILRFEDPKAKKPRFMRFHVETIRHGQSALAWISWTPDDTWKYNGFAESVDLNMKHWDFKEEYRRTFNKMFHLGDELEWNAGMPTA